MDFCPICRCDKIKVKFKLVENVYMCKNCGFHFAPNATFNKSLVSDLDEVTRLKALKKLRVLNFNKIILTMKKYTISGESGLEIGCGHGWFLETCKKNRIECSGIEPEMNFNSLYQDMGVEVLNGFFPDAVPANKKYDFIAYNDVFEHLPDIESTMIISNSLLNSKGKLIVSLPLRGGLIYNLSIIAYFLGIKSLLNRMWQFNFHSPHLSYFSKKNLIKLAEKADFEILESFPLKTINTSEIKDRVGEDKNSKPLFKNITILCVYFIYPVLQLFPDTYCFIFRKKK
ncbi:MAG: methyltransferase domain-containing protein [Bacteroidetes bacterium]|nr:methyltransferase domain-containing protein [Bacteroidota bacterium]